MVLCVFCRHEEICVFVAYWLQVRVMCSDYIALWRKRSTNITDKFYLQKRERGKIFIYYVTHLTIPQKLA